MIQSVRAAGFAVAALVLAASAAWSGPLQAGESDVAPVVSTYLDHAGASVEEFDLGVNDETVVTTPVTVSDRAQFDHVTAVADHLVQLADGILTHGQPLGQLVQSFAALSTDDREQDCLANAVYFEARGEPLEGQLAVAEVVLNRTRSGRYPQTICEVVTQPWQFSFVRNGIIPAADRNCDAWRRAVAIARIAERGASRLLPQNVLWYHADYVSPSWGRRLARNTKIGLHIFYS